MACWVKHLLKCNIPSKAFSGGLIQNVTLFQDFDYLIIVLRPSFIM